MDFSLEPTVAGAAFAALAVAGGGPIFSAGLRALRLSQRVARLAEKNKTRLAHDLKNHDKVIHLLSKARSNNLTLEEKESIRVELIDILRSIPTFVIISLPQKFLTLPILLKILPKNLFVENAV